MDGTFPHAAYDILYRTWKHFAITTGSSPFSLSSPRSGTFLLFATMCVPYLAIVRFLVPETTGKSLEEIEAYWGE